MISQYELLDHEAFGGTVGWNLCDVMKQQHRCGVFLLSGPLSRAAGPPEPPRWGALGPLFHRSRHRSLPRTSPPSFQSFQVRQRALADFIFPTVALAFLATFLLVACGWRCTELASTLSRHRLDSPIAPSTALLAAVRLAD